MNPVIGLDVSKGESHAQAFLDRGVPHRKIFRFNHDLEGLSSFLNYVRAVESAAGMSPCMVMEATGHYHSPRWYFLSKRSPLYLERIPYKGHFNSCTLLRNPARQRGKGSRTFDRLPRYLSLFSYRSPLVQLLLNQIQRQDHSTFHLV
ncbi:IS110 family transposase [Paenibacillus sp. PL91]|uniref:IS110 family transposase n=1 Tax=Paenibacillus sp. PL91 TaxID=2729538 RepID=UPI0021D5296B|nr:IS110 family transposase [Paenibacillus sp. PL91]